MATRSQSASPNGSASLALTELREFASFTPAAQRYIKRSLDVGLARHDAFKQWARSTAESDSISRQYHVYKAIRPIRVILEQEPEQAVGPLLALLMDMAAFDLGEERIDCFSAFRFLYERLLGPDVRPWLPAAYCGAAALPHIAPKRRKALLQSISEAAATAPGWSVRRPCFYPEWVDSVSNDLVP